MKKILTTLKFFTGVAASCLLLLVAAGFIEAYILTHPRRILAPGTMLARKNIAFQPLDLVTEDDIHLAAWYTPPQNGALILLTHGYGDNRSEQMYVMCVKAGYGVLAWDARAHGSSGGEISTFGYTEVLDVKAALVFAKTQSEVKHIGGWGDSMGAATLIRAAAQFPQIEAVVADSPYLSLDKEVDYLAPYPIVNPLAKHLLALKIGTDLKSESPIALIGKISPRAVFLIQGGGDEVAPPDSAQQLYDAAGEPRSLWFEPNVPHVAMVLDNPRKYERKVIGFFNEHLLSKQEER